VTPSAGEDTDASYPPAKHLLRDLALDVEHGGDGTSAAWLDVTPELLDDTGAVRAGVLATVVDMVGGGLSAHAAAPNWIATADLTLHVIGRATGGVVEANTRILRAGRTTVVLEVDLQCGRAPVALATMTFSVLPRRDDNPVITFASGEPERASLALPSSGFDQGVLDALGVDVHDAGAGVIEVPVTDYSRNSLGALQGGVVAVAAEVAAERALRAACRTPVTVKDLQLTYLALARGSLRTTTEVISASPSFGAALVDLVDVGAESRRTTTARVVATHEGA
jgi:acyl-coenzyme A thioesterase PaaI-like protein